MEVFIHLKIIFIIFILVPQESLDVYGKTRLKNHSTISVRIVDLEKVLL